ncbi:thiamine phosphate synthase [Rhodohalobacter sp. SW132]|uniref:thiamine phosphate synthase n=1 Tax=Rhodohalobacter sp. SW132 TaxID=2293433 RepID=UPI000E242D4C|nr:thiamine phosphate synthase [Rhodohalobacter sp. SW132]REL39004.1 thiamine phosphate synthase [Rhodohalobacter sp. SW132]
MRKADLSLYLVTDREMMKENSLPELVQIAAENGVTTVQLREKNASTREFIRLGFELKKVLDPLHIPLIINDRVDVALAVDAAGVHLGQNDMPVSIARNLLGRDKIIGLSVETEEDLETVDALQPDYLGVSPIYSTPTKTDTKREWGLTGLKMISERTSYPLVAIGGINIGNAQSILKNGADGLAVVSAICASEDPGCATAELRKQIDAIIKPQAHGI